MPICQAQLPHTEPNVHKKRRSPTENRRQVFKAPSTGRYPRATPPGKRKTGGNWQQVAGSGSDTRKTHRPPSTRRQTTARADSKPSLEKQTPTPGRESALRTAMPPSLFWPSWVSAKRGDPLWGSGVRRQGARELVWGPIPSRLRPPSDSRGMWVIYITRWVAAQDSSRASPRPGWRPPVGAALRPRPDPRGGAAARVPSRLRRPSGGPECLPRFPLGSLSCTLARPFPRPLGSDTIPIACRPAVQLNPFYPAGWLPWPSACPARGPLHTGRSFVRKRQHAAVVRNRWISIRR